MMRGSGWKVAAALLVTPLAWGCQSDGGNNPIASAGSAVADGVGSVANGVPSLVNVDLKDVLNDLAVKLNLDRSNIPINAQIPIQLAVNVCGVSINILSVSTGGQANCTAKTAPAELAQVVQQQIAAGGSVGGGAQGGSTSATSGTTATGGTSTSGSTGTGAQSTGSTETNTNDTSPPRDPALTSEAPPQPEPDSN
jgi:hypothetical protein